MSEFLLVILNGWIYSIILPECEKNSKMEVNSIVSKAWE